MSDRIYFFRSVSHMEPLRLTEVMAIFPGQLPTREDVALKSDLSYYMDEAGTVWTLGDQIPYWWDSEAGGCWRAGKWDEKVGDYFRPPTPKRA